MRIGFGDGEEVADGRFSAAREVDVWASGASRRRRREEELRRRNGSPPCSAAASGSTPARRCCCGPAPTSTPAAQREAALQLRVGFEALLAELRRRERRTRPRRGHGDAARAPGRGRRGRNAALAGELPRSKLQQVRELLELCERVLRRRRVLRG